MAIFPKGQRRGGDRIATDMQGIPVIAVYDPENDHIKMATTVDGDGAIKIYNFVYNPSTLQWERMSQPNIDAGEINIDLGDTTEAVKETYWRKTLYDYDGNDNIIYKGLHATYNVADTDVNHRIIKYTYTGSNLTMKQIAEGSWTGRASIGW